MEMELVVREGEESGRRFRIAPGERLTIGRSPDCDIRLPDQGVSRQHCTIENLGHRLHLIDRDSANGTYVNGEPIDDGPIIPGDMLAIGPAILECRTNMRSSSAIPVLSEAFDLTSRFRPASRKSSPSGHSGRATLALTDEEDTNTLVRKKVDTSYPGIEHSDPGSSAQLTELQRAQRNLATAFQVSQILASAPDLDDLFDGVIDSIFSAINADRAALLLKDGRGDSDDLNIVAARTRSAKAKPGQIVVSRTVVRDVLEKGISSISSDASADDRFKEGQSIIQHQIRAVMCAPVATDESVLGVLYVDSRSMKGAFTESDLELLALIGNQAGIGIHRAQLLAQLEQFFFDTIRAIVATIDAKDGYTHRHSERVAAVSVRIARELGVSEKEIQVIELSALLHDVGKVGVPDSILNKPGRLTPEEFDEIKKHPVYGVNILQHIKSPRFEAILPGVRSHHEHWDGSGYPDGLAGRDIPFLGRLLAVADVLDALSSKRSYRAGLGFSKAVEIIEREAGTHFDPEIAEAAIALHKRGELEAPREWIEPGSYATPIT